MNLAARIKGSTLEIFDVRSGGIMRSHALPPGEYTNIMVSGDNVSVTIKTPYSGSRIRTVNMKSGSIISEFPF